MLRKSLLFHFIYVLCVERIDIYLFIYLSPHPAIPREAVWTFSSPTKLKIVKNTYNRHRNVIILLLYQKNPALFYATNRAELSLQLPISQCLKGQCHEIFWHFFIS